mmetsp:Transcript_20250/g.31712  ORF Transcript_20250/g.31712 Transcript_20250/m.31712 type:complete len:284 (+) Transcript_20250:654-1505(+)
MRAVPKILSLAWRSQSISMGLAQYQADHTWKEQMSGTIDTEMEKTHLHIETRLQRIRVRRGIPAWGMMMAPKNADPLAGKSVRKRMIQNRARVMNMGPRRVFIQVRAIRSLTRLGSQEDGLLSKATHTQEKKPKGERIHNSSPRPYHAGLTRMVVEKRALRTRLTKAKIWKSLDPPVVMGTIKEELGKRSRIARLHPDHMSATKARVEEHMVWTGLTTKAQISLALHAAIGVRRETAVKHSRGVRPEIMEMIKERVEKYVVRTRFIVKALMIFNLRIATSMVR